MLKSNEHEQAYSEESKKDRHTQLFVSPLVRNFFIAGALLVVSIVLALFFWPDSTHNKEHESFDVQAICELATLKCRYHNVAYMSESAGFLDLGHKEVWLEFDGYITIGIDVDNVYISDPSDDGVIQIYLPPTKMLSSIIEKDSIQKPVCDTSLFIEVTAEEELELVQAAQNETENDAQINTKLFKEAEHNAKAILEQYILSIGKLTGKTYSIEWLETAPNTAPAN